MFNRHQHIYDAPCYEQHLAFQVLFYKQIHIFDRHNQTYLAIMMFIALAVLYKLCPNQNAMQPSKYSLSNFKRKVTDMRTKGQLLVKK